MVGAANTPLGTAGSDAVRLLTYSEAVGRLASKQKSAKGSPADSRFINEGWAGTLLRRHTGPVWWPNTVTAISALFTFAAIAVLALARPSWGIGFIVAACLVIGYALDSADGQLARLLGGGSLAGEWLDHMVDATKATTLHLAVLLTAYRFFGLSSAAWLLVPLGFATVSAVMFFGMTLNDQLRRNSELAGAPPVVRNASSLLKSLMVLPTDYGLLCLVFLLLGSQAAFGIVYTLLFAGSFGFLLMAAVKWFKDMKALDDSIRAAQR